MASPFLHSSQEQSRPWVETPLRESYALSQAAGCRIFLKMETLQPSGSFKSRGIGHYLLARLSALPPSPTPHIFCSSGGNAGLAAVHASRTLSLPCTVVVPETINPLMIAKIKAAGAYQVLAHGNAWAEADAYLRDVVMPRSGKGDAAVYVPPFDHPDIWEGNASLMREVLGQMPGGEAPDVVVCSVGGGGLLNGIGIALEERNKGWPTIVGVETAGAESLAASLSAGSLVTLPRITSKATSLGCARVTQMTLDIAQRPEYRGAVLTDGEAAMGCWRLAEEERVMVELACGVSVAVCLGGRLERALGRRVRPEEKVVVVVCGGSNVTVGMLEGWKGEFGGLEHGERGVGEEKEVDEPIIQEEIYQEERVRKQRRWEGGEVLQLEAKL